MRDQSVVDLAMPNMESVVFTASRKRWVPPGIFVGSMLALLAIWIFFGLFLLDQPFITHPDSIVILFAFVCWAGIAVMIVYVVISFVMKMMKIFMESLRLQIDASGLTASAPGQEHQYRIQWSQLEEIRIIRPPSSFGPDELWLVVWARPGVPDPTKEMFPSEWRMDIGGVKVCEVNHFSRPAVEIGNAVARFAGKRWNESREPR